MIIIAQAVFSLLYNENSNIAQCALYLSSDDSSFVSGQIVAVDGGWTAF